MTEYTVSAVLVKDVDGLQHPIYYVSKSLLQAETRYSSLEKLSLALIMACIKLKPYFESHPICVRTNYPLKTIMSKPELSGRMSKWSVRLSTYDLTYEPRTSIKLHALADFMADFSPSLALKDVMITETPSGLRVIEPEDTRPWVLHIDGASNARGTGLGIVLQSPQGDKVVLSISCEFRATNNEAEYEALIQGLQLTFDMGIRKVHVNSDSLLIVSQVDGSYEAKDARMAEYLKIVKQLFEKFESYSLSQVPRDQNTEADALGGVGSNFSSSDVCHIPIVHLMYPATHEVESDVTVTNVNSNSWTQPLYDYLRHNVFYLRVRLIHMVLG